MAAEGYTGDFPRSSFIISVLNCCGGHVTLTPIIQLYMCIPHLLAVVESTYTHLHAYNILLAITFQYLMQ